MAAVSGPESVLQDWLGGKQGGAAQEDWADTEAGVPGARRDYRVYYDPHKPKAPAARASCSL